MTPFHFKNYGSFSGHLSPSVHAHKAGGPVLFTVEEIVDNFPVSIQTVYRWLKAGSLRGVQVGGRGKWFIPADEIDRVFSLPSDLSREEMEYLRNAGGA